MHGKELCHFSLRAKMVLFEKNGAKINSCTREGDNPFLIACENWKTALYNILLSDGAGINFCTENEDTSFYIVCENGQDSIVQLLLDNGANIDSLYIIIIVT